MNRLTKFMLLALSLLVATSSQAALYRAGPNDNPSPPGNGYPVWYQDTNGLALDLCVPQTLNQLDVCLATPAPGDPLPSLPYTFPTNWPDEFFWYGAEAAMDFGGGNSAILVQAIEAAFGLGGAAIGDQIVFSRIRFVIDAPVDGTYTVTYPYGKEVFPGIQAGPRAVFFTSDVGIGAPGDFTGALNGAVGPYLTPVDVNGAAVAPVVIDGDSFLTDGAAPTRVTGSPFTEFNPITGVNEETNYFEICVDNIDGRGLNGGIGGAKCARTADFIVIGKVHTAPIDSPLNIARATYSTHAGMPMAHIDVFASAEAGPGALEPVLTLGIPEAASVLMDGPQNPGGQFYGEGIVELAMLPNTVTVINSADLPASSMERDLVDAVTITMSEYDATLGILTVAATSSDEDGAPELVAIGIPGSATGSDALDSLTGSLSQTLPVGAVPPQTVTVVSKAGGTATAIVTMPMHGVIFPTGAPLAINDNVVTGEDTAVNIAVLANDGAEADPASLTLYPVGSQPAHGTAALIIGGTVDYTPDPGYFGADSFQYTVSSAAGLSSNIATVTIDVQLINDAPIANDDAANAPLVSAIVNVIANDTDLDGIAPAPGGLDPTSVVVTSVSAGASLINHFDGTVTFTKEGCELSIPQSCSFTYTVSDIGTPVLTSNAATVTITSATNQAPTANNDAASVLVDGSITIDVAANDTDDIGLDLTSIVVTTPPLNGSALANPDGTITFGAGPNPGTVTFGYTIADTFVPAVESNEAIVTVTVNPLLDTLGVQRAQCKQGKDEWRVDGTSSVLTPHSVTVYAGATVGGTVLATNLPVDNLGTWRMSKNNVSAACVSAISIESSLGGKLENVGVTLN